MSSIQLIVTMITVLLLLGLILGGQFVTEDVVKKETLGVQVTRTENAALALTSVPSGHIEIPMEGSYEFRWRDPKVYMRYDGTVESKSIDLLENGYTDVNGPNDYTEIEGTLCLRKDGDSLTFQTSPCRETGSSRRTGSTASSDGTGGSATDDSGSGSSGSGSDGSSGSGGSGQASGTEGSFISSTTDYSEFEQKYVSASSDGGAGTKQDPWSVSQAEDAGAGTVVNFLPGTYSSNFQVPSGSSGDPVVFRSSERHAAKMSNDGGYAFQIEGSNSMVVGFTIEPEGGGLFEVKGAENIVIRDNYMDNSRSSQTPSYIDNSEFVQFRNNVLRGGTNYDNLRMEGNNKIVFSGNFFGKAAHSPFGLYDGKQGDGPVSENRNIVIRGNVFAGVTSRSFSVFRSDDVLFEKNIVTNGFNGPKSASTASKFAARRGIFRFNRVYSNHGTAVTIPTYTNNIFSIKTRIYNNVWDKNRGQWEKAGNSNVVVNSYGKHDQLKNTAFVNNVFSRNNDAEVMVRDLGDSQVPFHHNILYDSAGDVKIKRADWYDPTKLSLNQVESSWGGLWYENKETRPGFQDIDGYDYLPSGGGSLVDSGTYLTEASNSGSDTQLEVEDPNFFYDGFGIPGESGDRIKVGGEIATIESVESSSITLENRINWDSGDPVSLVYEGAKPEIGAYETGSRKQVVIDSDGFSFDKGEQITFTAETKGIENPVEICWQFGDGSGACGRSVTHSYQQRGDFGVRARVIDSEGEIHWGNDYVLAGIGSGGLNSIEYNKDVTSELLCDGEGLVKGSDEWVCG